MPPATTNPLAWRRNVGLSSRPLPSPNELYPTSLKSTKPVLGLKTNKSTNKPARKSEVLTKTKIALCVAIAVGAAVPPATFAFAGNMYDSPDWAAPRYGWDAHRPSAAGTHESNAQGTAPARRGDRNAGRQPIAPRTGY
jgi:hypothetical protein